MHRYVNGEQLLSLCSSAESCPVENKEQAELIISFFELSGNILELGRSGSGLYSVATDQNGTRRKKIAIDDVISQACEMNYEYASLKKETLAGTAASSYDLRQIAKLYKEYTDISSKEKMFEGIFRKTSYHEKTRLLLLKKQEEVRPLPKRTVSR